MRYRVILLVLFGVGFAACISDSGSVAISSKRGAFFSIFARVNDVHDADSLRAPFPNPFTASSDSIAIEFSLKDSSTVLILIQNPLGDEILGFASTTTLDPGQQSSDGFIAPGFYRGRWKPVDRNGKALASGLYFITLRAETLDLRRIVNSRLFEIQ